MILVTKNTERKLLERLRYYWQQAPAQRCLHIKLSLLNEETQGNHQIWIREIFDVFQNTMHDQSMEFYACNDRDIFILARDLTQKRVDEVFAHLAPKLTPALLSPGLASLFEIGVDWHRLRKISQKKVEAIALAKALAKHKKQETLEQISKTDALKALDQDLIQTLGERREKREKSEIMVVEDDPFSQKMIGNALKGRYSISISNDGAGALMSYVRYAPDVLFLDIGLPDLNGHEVLERLFKIDPTAYVVMFSGNGDRENVLKAVELGAKGFVGKPFTKEKLIAYIEKSPFIHQKKNRGKVYGNFIQ